MSKKTSQEIRNAGGYAADIAQHPAYLTSMPRLDFSDPTSHEQFEKGRSRAIKLGAVAVADTHPTHSLEHYQFKAFSQIEDFYDGQLGIDHFRNRYANQEGEIDWSKVPAEDSRAFSDDKAKVRELNNTLGEIIDSAGDRMSFSDLLTFIVNAGVQINHDKINPATLQHMTRESLIGTRNEIAYEQALIAANIPYRRGTTKEDAIGWDFIIYNKGYDLKTSKTGVEKARDKKRRQGKNPYLVVGDYFDFEDFNGKLTLPLDTIDSKVHVIREDIYNAHRWSTSSRTASY